MLKDFEICHIEKKQMSRIVILTHTFFYAIGHIRHNALSFRKFSEVLPRCAHVPFIQKLLSELRLPYDVSNITILLCSCHPEQKQHLSLPLCLIPMVPRFIPNPSSVAHLILEAELTNISISLSYVEVINSSFLL